MNKKILSSTMGKVVFTTAVGKIPDYFYVSVRKHPLRMSLPTPAFGLRFITYNIPGIEMLEYPNWDQFKKKLKEDIDILGISYFMKDVPIVKEMIKVARANGVKEIWGGNYGVLCEETKEWFDRTCEGYSESQISEWLGYGPLKSIKHPPIISTIGLHFPPIKRKQGYLFTTRGCRMRCKFCQTPSVTPNVSTIPLDNIEEALKIYKKERVKTVFVMDDNFLQQKKYSEDLIDLFYKYNIKWSACTRAEYLKGRVREFRDKGFHMVLVGIESMRQTNLDKINKSTSMNNLVEVINELNENNIYIHGTYILGYEDDTDESIKEDIKKLSKLGIDSFQVTILTPLPRTPLWTEMSEKYTIIKDYSQFDTYHLVWNHPNISKGKMHNLRNYAWSTLYPPKNLFHGAWKIKKQGLFLHFLNPF